MTAALKLLTIETVAPIESEWSQPYFDNTDGIGPVKRELFYRHRSGVMLPYKGAPIDVPITSRIGVCAHITAIAFGTTSRQRRFWGLLIDDGTVPSDVWRKFGEVAEAAAQRMALHKRFWTVPYHWVGMLNGDILKNNGISRYTYAGNGSNRHHVQVAAEANLPGLEKHRKPGRYHELSEHNILTWRGALRLAFEEGRGEGAPLEELTAHRRYSKGRVGDPGEGWWREVGLPIAKEVGAKIVYTDTNKLGGRDHPIEWDGNGLVDYRGRPIRR